MTTTADVHVHVHRDPPDVVGRRDRMGVLLIILADVSFVACLIFSYLYLRFLNVEGKWLPEEVTPPPAAPTWIIVAALVVGALALALGVRGMQAARRGALLLWSVVALIAAVAALVLQWMQATSFDFPLQENGRFISAYTSSMYLLAGANLFHIGLAVFVTLGIVIRTARGRYADPASWQPRIVSYWWVWVVVSAILVGLMTTFLVDTPFPPSVPGVTE